MSKRESPFAKLKDLAAPADEELKQSRVDLVAGSSSTRKLAGALLVHVELIAKNGRQVRQVFNEETLKELAQDIKERGILEPLIVRETGEGMYEIIAGERRFRAAKMAGLSEVPVLIKDMNDKEARFAMLVENIQREDLDPSDERRFFQELMNEYNLTLVEIGKLINKSKGYVQNRMENKLRSMQQPEKALETHDDEADSEENNKNTSQVAKLKISQSDTMTRNPRFDNAFQRFSKALDTTLVSLETHTTDKDTATQILSQVAEMEQKLGHLKQKLTNFAAPKIGKSDDQEAD